MNVNTDLKKAAIIFGGGIILFYVFKKIRPLGFAKKNKKNKGNEGKSAVDKGDQQKNAAVAILAYGNAKRAGEPKEVLDELNAEFAKLYGLRVYVNRTNGKLIASDLEGNQIS